MGIFISDKYEMPTNYITAIASLKFEPVSSHVWKTIRAEGLDEEQSMPNRQDWEVQILPISDEDSNSLKAMSDDALEKFNLFDIELKEKYGGRLVDLVDYDNGVVLIVRSRQLKESTLNNIAQILLNEASLNLTEFRYGMIDANLKGKQRPGLNYGGYVDGFKYQMKQIGIKHGEDGATTPWRPDDVDYMVGFEQGKSMEKRTYVFTLGDRIMTQVMATSQKEAWEKALSPTNVTIATDRLIETPGEFVSRMRSGNIVVTSYPLGK